MCVAICPLYEFNKAHWTKGRALETLVFVTKSPKFTKSLFSLNCKQHALTPIYWSLDTLSLTPECHCHPKQSSQTPRLEPSTSQSDLSRPKKAFCILKHETYGK